MGVSVSAQAVDAAADKHRDALDGVRALAITLVIQFHSLRFYSGWAGVQIFFVLSGFLITSILLRDSDLPLSLYLKRFYWRRALRIFPLYYGYILVFAVVYAIFRAPEVFGRDWPWLLTYTLNFRRIWPDFGSNIYYGRFWTLAVEEQFYLAWPLLVYCFPRKYFAALVACLLVAAPIIRAFTPALFAPVLHSDTDLLGAAVYYFSPGQVDSFAAGAAIALFGRQLRSKSIIILIGSTLLLLVCGQVNALICTGKLALDSGLGYPVNMFQGFQHIWGYSVINIWAGALILAASSRNWIASLFALPWIAYIGRISYGMYVYHQIILFAGLKKFGSLFMNTRHGFWSYYLCVVLISHLSYRFYESRFLGLKNARFRRPAAQPNQRVVSDLLETPV